MTEKFSEPPARMTLRLAPYLRRRLGEAAGISGRSITQEIETRLEQSFWKDRLAEIVTQAVKDAQK